MAIVLSPFAGGSESLTGTNDADIIISQEGNGAGTTDTLLAGGGNDVVIGDSDALHVDAVAGNNSIATAQDIDISGYWSTQENPLVADDTVPYTTVVGQGAGEADFFAVTIGAGETLTADIDFGDGVYGGGAFDSTLTLFDGSGTQLALDDDSGTGEGGLGSVSTLDSLLSYTNTTGTAQTFYIKVDSFSATGVPVDATYLMNVSVTGHAASNAAVQSDDSINGEAGDDYLIGNGGNDTLIGGTGADVLEGGSGNDSLVGGTSDLADGVDTINGGAGNDTIIGGYYADILNGGSGDDVFQVFNDDNPGSIDGGADTDTFDASGVANLFLDLNLEAKTVELTVVTNPASGVSGTIVNVENVIGTQNGDSITGDSLGNVLDGGGGNDTLIGGAGDDTLIGGLGNDSLVGGADTDTADYSGATGPISGTLYANGRGTISGVGTDDLSEVEVLIGTEHADSLYVILSKDMSVFAGEGADEISASGGAAGGPDGNSLMHAGGGDDTVRAINSSYIGDLDGGADTDTFDASANTTSGMRIDLANETHDFFVYPDLSDLLNFENVIGTQLGDSITGDAQGNELDGQAGNDTINGGGGFDEIYGGDGADLIRGSLGDDGIFGGDDHFADTLDYSDANVSLDVEIMTDYFGGGFEGNVTGLGNDGFVNIEVFIGSDQNDVYTVDLGGMFNEHTLYAGDGADSITVVEAFARTSIDAGAGDDTVFGSQRELSADFDGGGDTDTFDFSAMDQGAFRAVRIDLAGESYSLLQEPGFGGMLAGFENAVGTQAGDVIIGDAGANRLDGQAGADTIDGGLGNDTLFGGADGDTFIYNGGHDVIEDLDGADLVFLDPALWGGTITGLLSNAVETAGGVFLQLDAENSLTFANITDADDLYGQIFFEGDAPVASDVAFDFDGNGTSDVLFRNPVNGQMALYLMDNGVPTAANIGGSNPAWEVIGTGDFTGDGTTDILWRNPADGKMGLYVMNDGSPSWKSLGGSNTAWDVVGTGDFDGDGTDDILWRNPTDGKMGLYLMEDGSQSWKALGGSNTAWDIVGTGDFNGDGTDDILWRNLGTGQMGMDLMDDAAKSWQKLGSSNTDWDVIGTGDFNGDGVDDILWRNLDDGEMGFYLMDESANKTWQKLGSSNPDWDVVGTGDYNGDGVDDLLWRNLDTGQMGMYLLDENANKTWQRLDDSNPNWNVEGYFDDVLA